MFRNTLTLHCPFPSVFLALGTAAFFFWQSPGLTSQTPSFFASIDIKEAIVGVPFEVTFTLTDAEGQRFVPPSFRDFVPTGIVSESRGAAIIKGRTSSKQSWSYSLEPTRAGAFTLGAAAVSVGGKVLNSAPLTINVLASPATKAVRNVPPGSNDQVFIVGSLSKEKAFSGEQVFWRLILYTRVAIEGADLISMPDFDGFYSKERRHFDTRTQYQTIQGKKYAVKTLHEESLFPQNTGKLTIGSAQIRVGLDQPAGQQGFFFGPKPVTLTSQPVSINVLPLPEPVPEGFTGGVGLYEWEVQADTNSLTTDDALTLTVLLKGNGDSRRFAAPKIEVPPTFEIFEPRILEEAENENETEIVHRKKLEYVVLPKEPGIQTFVPKLTYFNIDSNRYCTIYAAPIRIEVTAGANYIAPNAVIDSIPPPPKQTDAFFKIWEKTTGFLSAPTFLAVFLLSGAIIGLVWFFKKRKEKRPLAIPKTKADLARLAHQRFVNVGMLLHNAPPETFYNELLKSLQSYISTRLDLAPAQLNQATLRIKLTERSVTPIRVQAFLSILQTCEQAVFSGHSEASKMASDWRTAEAVIHELEKEIR